MMLSHNMEALGMWSPLGVDEEDLKEDPDVLAASVIDPF